ncbi:MAG: YggS family pyridoxal phosphate-dependent enzyme [Hungatella sp.]
MQKQLQEVIQKIEAACQRVGRDPKEVTLIAVSKTKPAEMVEEAYRLGVRDFGENKVQEIAKVPVLPQDIRWHMIGHLQTSKIRTLLGKTVMIHSVDSVHLAEKLEEEAARQNLTVDILLEINVAREESKFGFFLEEAEDAVMKIRDFTHLRICGFMTSAPFVENAEENRDVFKKLNHFYVDMKSKNIDNTNMSVLSMGMTNDYEIAIEEGATMVRIGTAIFGAR